jgi:membrane-associated protein
MEIIVSILDFILHIDTHLGEIIVRYGTLSYAILFAIIFSETGFVFTPFLPGDSLLFAAGAFAAIGSFNIVALLFLLWCAAFLGDTVNYWIGRYFGQKIIDNRKIPINQEHINKAQRFYDKYGGKTIFLARFVPIVRTFAPFVAGIGKMNYRKFIYYNIAGGICWVFGFLLLGYFFGNLPSIKENFSIVIIAIIILSVIPVLSELIKTKLKKTKPIIDKIHQDNNHLM